MPLIITDDVLQSAGMSETEARLEFACRLFDADRLTLWQAARLAGLTRGQFEDELMRRGIAAYRPTVDDVRRDLATLNELGV